MRKMPMTTPEPPRVRVELWRPIRVEFWRTAIGLCGAAGFARLILWGEALATPGGRCLGYALAISAFASVLLGLLSARLVGHSSARRKAAVAAIACLPAYAGWVALAGVAETRVQVTCAAGLLPLGTFSYLCLTEQFALNRAMIGEAWPKLPRGLMRALEWTSWFLMLMFLWAGYIVSAMAAFLALRP